MAKRLTRVTGRGNGALEVNNFNAICYINYNFPYLLYWKRGNGAVVSAHLDMTYRELTVQGTTNVD